MPLWHGSAVSYMWYSFPIPISLSPGNYLTMYSSFFSTCGPGGTSSHICAFSPVSHFSWHRKPVLPLLHVLLISPPLLCFPRGTSCCQTLSRGILYNQNQYQTWPPTLRMHYIYFTLHGMFSLHSRTTPLSLMSPCKCTQQTFSAAITIAE